MNFYTDNNDLVYHFKKFDFSEITPLCEGENKRTAAEMVPQYEAGLQTVGEMAGEKIAPRAMDVDVECAHCKDGVVTMAKGTIENLKDIQAAGLCGVTLAKRYGGLNYPVTVYSMMTEIISRADASLQNLFGLQSIAQTIQKFGSEEQKQEYLPKFASGEYDGAMALTEPDHGSDLQAVETSATQDPENPNIWRLNGVKHFITNGSAKVLLVLARSEAGTRDGRGLSMFIAKAGPQIKIHRIERKLGIHGSPTCELHFENAPAELVGQRRFGLIKYVMSLMNGARLAICSQAVGLAEAARRKAWDWTMNREQFGKKLCDIPPVRDMLERMDSQVLAGRALLYETSKCVDLRDGYEAKSLADRDDADAKEKVKNYTKLAALLTPMVKFFTTEMANAVAYDAIQCHGGKGYMFEHEVERLYRDARIMNIYEGTSQLQIVAATGGVMTHVLDSTLDELETVEHADEKLRALAAKVKTARALTDEAIALVEKEMKDKTELVARRLVRMQTIVYTSLLMLREVECDNGRMAATVRYVSEMVPEVAMNMEIIKSLKD